jgi:hypothetical protein
MDDSVELTSDASRTEEPQSTRKREFRYSLQVKAWKG